MFDNSYNQKAVDPVALSKTYQKNAANNKKMFCDTMMEKIPNNMQSGNHSLWHLDTLSNIIQHFGKYS